jgi:hypothetical protein
LKTGEGVECSSAGDYIAVNMTLVAVTVEVNVVDASRAYNVEVITSPSGTPSVVGTLNLPTSTRGAGTVSLSAAVAAGSEIGVRMVRSSGSGGSSFDDINVTVVLEQ